VSKKRRLGRGLEALLGAPIEESPNGTGVEVIDEPNDTDKPAGKGNGKKAKADKKVEEGDLIWINVDEIDPNPYQPRREFTGSELEALKQSLVDHDMLQPILVRRAGVRYELISGERRWRAAILAKWPKIPARIRRADDRMVAELAIVENLQRVDLNAIEKALSFKRYIDSHKCQQEELAKRLSIDRSTISNLLRLLELPNPVQEAVVDGAITAGHARALLTLKGKLDQEAFCELIKSEGWSVRETERRIHDPTGSTFDDHDPADLNLEYEIDEEAEEILEKMKTELPAQSAQLESLIKELKIAVGSKVEIHETGQGKGKIVLHFNSHDEFERLRDILTDRDTEPLRAVS